MFERREPSGEDIARRAYELYIQRGGDHGKDVEDWVRAERELSDGPRAGPAKTRATQVVRKASN
ncbi:MAG: hypothetical protein DMG41_34815 [Acidobacteria bacterium]|nr:MAG: hypothetical protein DMG42_10805 [Acidobacteriota bacterium]PYT81582.1 MAG: hypothetical protein DMG41_34815 [Acidobacteriota bacterium]